MRRLQIQTIPAVKMGADPRQVERNFAAVKAVIEAGEVEDVVVETPRRLLLRSPDGHYWAIAVTNAGALTATDVGTTL